MGLLIVTVNKEKEENLEGNMGSIWDRDKLSLSACFIFKCR